MFYFGDFEFELIINNNQVEVDPASYSFSMRDSIHDFYSQMTFSIMDVTGILQDVLLTAEGIPFTITYGLKDDFRNKCSYVVESDDVPRVLSSDSIGGRININLVNSYYSKQAIESKAYSGRISDVIRTVISNEFNTLNINDTGCDTTWYRPLLTQKDFIENILLPNSFSNNSRQSPFFCFINSNNEFNLRNYNSMISTSVKQNFKLINYSSQKNLDKGIILDIKRIKLGSNITRDKWNRQIYSRNLNTGTFDEIEDHIYNYPSVFGNLTILSQSDNTGVLDLLYKETDVPLQEAFNGRKINSMKDTFFLERFIITTLFTPKLKSGDLVYLDLPIKNLVKSSEVSLSYSDNYLIESSDHIWNGEKRQGYSQFIVSRKFAKIPNTSLIKNRLFAGA